MHCDCIPFIRHFKPSPRTIGDLLKEPLDTKEILFELLLVVIRVL
jgi:hypothetical protein